MSKTKANSDIEKPQKTIKKIKMCVNPLNKKIEKSNI
jgi:hypothetical protein